MRLPVLWLDGAYVYVESQCFFLAFFTHLVSPSSLEIARKFS